MNQDKVATQHQSRKSMLEDAPRLLRAVAFGLVNPKAKEAAAWFQDPRHERAISNYLKMLADAIEQNTKDIGTKQPTTESHE